VRYSPIVVRVILSLLRFSKLKIQGPRPHVCEPSLIDKKYDKVGQKKEGRNQQ